MIPKGIKDRLRHILHLDETPHLLAKSFAAGVFIAFTPFIGLHILSALVVAWAFRLNKVVTLTGTMVCNPWTIAFIFIGPTWLTVMAMRHVGMDVPPLNYDTVSGHFMFVLESYSVWQARFWVEFLQEFKPYIAAVLVGTTLAGAAAAFASYFAAVKWIWFYRLKKAERRHGRAHGGKEQG
ncbi:MAG: DUF2062 domain-containing protein [Nitrospirae bacterium]|nr:DUF2062 domain-containing protein [Nitrospirota bacterium]